MSESKWTKEYQLKVEKEFNETVEKQRIKFQQRRSNLEILIEAYDEIDALLAEQDQS